MNLLLLLTYSETFAWTVVLCCLEHHDFESELKYRLKPPLPFLMGCGVGVQLDTLIMLDSTQIGDFEFRNLTLF